MDREVDGLAERQVHFEIAALEATFLDYVQQVSHQAERITELEKAIDAAIAGRRQQIRAVVEALQALRGVAKVTAMTLWPRSDRFPVRKRRR